MVEATKFKPRLTPEQIERQKAEMWAQPTPAEVERQKADLWNQKKAGVLDAPESAAVLPDAKGEIRKRHHDTERVLEGKRRLLTARVSGSKLDSRVRSRKLEAVPHLSPDELDAQLGAFRSPKTPEKVRVAGQISEGLTEYYEGRSPEFEPVTEGKVVLPQELDSGNIFVRTWGALKRGADAVTGGVLTDTLHENESTVRKYNVHPRDRDMLDHVTFQYPEGTQKFLNEADERRRQYINALKAEGVEKTRDELPIYINRRYSVPRIRELQNQHNALVADKKQRVVELQVGADRARANGDISKAEELAWVGAKAFLASTVRKPGAAPVESNEASPEEIAAQMKAQAERKGPTLGELFPGLSDKLRAQEQAAAEQRAIELRNVAERIKAGFEAANYPQLALPERSSVTDLDARLSERDRTLRDAAEASDRVIAEGRRKLDETPISTRPIETEEQYQQRVLADSQKRSEGKARRLQAKEQAALNKAAQKVDSIAAEEAARSRAAREKEDRLLAQAAQQYDANKRRADKELRQSAEWTAAEREAVKKIEQAKARLRSNKEV